MGGGVCRLGLSATWSQEIRLSPPGGKSDRRILWEEGDRKILASENLSKSQLA